MTVLSHLRWSIGASPNANGLVASQANFAVLYRRLGLDDSAQKAWLRTLGATGSRLARPSIVQDAIDRTRAAVSSLSDSKTTEVQFVVVDRLLVGLAEPSPFEVGISLSTTYGCPVVRGSGLKGAALRVLRSHDKEQAKRVFGTEETAGQVTVLDAMPLTVKVGVDVFTPHVGPYHQEGAPPAVWHQPVPVEMLILEAGTRFVTFVTSSDESAHKLALEALVIALEDYGIGGKTSSGFGYCHVTTKEVDGQ